MFKTVSNQVKQQRLAVCAACSDYISRVKICRQCGCYMPAKALFADIECPQQKWLKNQPGTGLINKIEEAILQSWNNS